MSGLPELELTLLRFYRRPGDGWHLAFLEVQNFFNGCSWALLSVNWRWPRGILSITFWS